jgi:hypothetical protein
MGLFPRDAEAELDVLPRGKGSKIFIVDPANGSDSNPGTKFDSPLKTISAAYAKCTANKNDTVFVAGNQTVAQLTAALTWGKDFTHLVGLGARTRSTPLAKIVSPAALATSPAITFSAKGCVVKNITLQHGSSNAASLVDVSLTGSNNYFQDVHFKGGMTAAGYVDGSYSLSVDGGTDNFFSHCTFGQNEVAAPTGVGGLGLSLSAARNTWEDCIFLVAASNAGAFHAEILLATGVASWNIWRNCMFLNTTATALTTVFVSPGGLANTVRLYFDNCWYEAATDLCVDAQAFMNMSITTGATTSGKLIVNS